MNKENNHIDNFLKDKFSSFEGNIPLTDWYDIEKKLNQRKKRVIFLWLSVASLIFIGIFTIYFISNNNKTSGIKLTIKEPQNSEKILIHKSPINNYKDKLRKKEKIVKQYKFDKSINDIINIEQQDVLNTNYNVYQPLELSSKIIDDIFEFKTDEPQKAKNLNLKNLTFIKKEKQNKFSFETGINLSPAWGMEVIKENKTMNKFINRSYFNSISGSSSFGNGMNNGLNFQINYGKNLFLRTGLYLSSYSIYHNYNYTISEFPNVDPKYGILVYTNKLPESIKHEGSSMVKFVAIPFAFGNRIFITPKFGFENKISINISRFASANGKSVNPTYLNLEDIKSQNIRKWSNGYTLSAGMFYKSKRNFIFTIEPNYSSIIGSAYNKTYPVKTRLYNYGLNFNVNYIIK